MDFEEIATYRPYGLEQEQKENILGARLLELTRHHSARCAAYRRILESTGACAQPFCSYAQLPFLPVRLFGRLDLKSVPDQEVVKTMTSSGTTGAAVSRIYLDRRTAANQQKALVKTVSEFTGSGRMPLLILDCPGVIRNRAMFSARGAGILGFSVFASKKMYAFDDQMRLDVEGLERFLCEHAGRRILLFGFTFLVWQYFYKELVRLKGQGTVFDFSDGILIHGGGWKKLASEAVSPEEFRSGFLDVCGLKAVHNYYGMVEQTGGIYMECEYGHLHAGIFSDILVRRPLDYSLCETGETGIIQAVSTIPESYPGHSILTEDVGVILGTDDCPCGRKGKYFRVQGRLAHAQIRGCSDTYAG